MTPKDLAKKEIEALVQKFEDHKSEYRQTEYNETQTRRDFIDPFFEALGWDISNKEKISEAYREVIHEDRVKVENKLKSPDYSFRINGKRYFFVEAKKPSVNIKDDIQPAYQVKRYAWSAKLTISIATDFEEFAVYDCTNKPNPADKASTARIEYIKYNEYLEKFDFIWDTFSKEAVLSGSHEKFLKKDKKKGTTSVDDDFLESLDKWRTTLAKDIHKNNPKLSEDYLNLVVQNTIDRIIFLRIAEDRNVEAYGKIKKCQSSEDIYQSLFKLFTDADDKYNSGLFDFEKDKVSKSVTISNKCLENIIEDLYFPQSPYEFSVIPVEILGSAYEQFLGKTIQLKNGKIAIEEKPEVRKAGGVYYTPQYIVDYIVQNTVGKLIEGKKPSEIEKIKILDPASGSGSFLLGAYDYLLRYHLDWYSKNAVKSKGKKEDPLNPDGSLTTEVKKKILLNNIYGVDIDSNAVEVTKLSLLLKCLEGETQASIKSQMSLFSERVLPTLDQNIKCGNSLVSTDFYEMESDQTVLKKVKPFNWKIEFREIFKNGGFDVVIGNPPYIRIQVLNDLAMGLTSYFARTFKSAHSGNYDIYVTFIENGLRLLSSNGLVGYIVPNKFISATYGLGIREIISKEQALSKVVYFGDQQVFKNATTYTCLVFLSKISNIKFELENVVDIKLWQLDQKSEKIKILSSRISEKPWILTNEKAAELIKKMYENGTSLSMNTERIYQGFKTGADKVFILEMIKREKSFSLLKCALDGKEYKIENALLKNIIKGGDSKPFAFLSSGLVILFPYGPNSELIRSAEFSKKYPFAWEYLSTHKKYLVKREKGRFDNAAWYGFSRSQALDVMLRPKIFTPDIAKFPSFALDPYGAIAFTGGVSGGYGVIPKKESNFLSFLGFLNSKLVNWFIKNTSTQMRGGYFSFEAKFIKNVPLPKKMTSAKYDSSVLNSYVIKLLELNRSAEPDQKQIQHFENEIDKLVYELYGLTQDEIKIIEEATGGN